MPQAAVRLAVPADRPAIEHLLRSAGNFNDEECDVALELVDVFFGHGPTAGPEGDYPTLVAELDGRVLGYATIGKTPFTIGTWHLYFIASDVTRRRTGIGRTLCHAIRDFATARGGQRLVLETSGRDLYDATRAFYASAGFHEEGRIADYYSPGDPVVYYLWRW